MAEFTGTSGNDTFTNLGGGGTLTLVVAGSKAQDIWPSIDILVDNDVIQSNVSVTADNNAIPGATQTVTVAVPPGASSFAIHYKNDPQTDYAEDRNLYVKSVALNGIAFDPSTAVYDVNNADGSHNRTVAGQADMAWGGTMTWKGTAVTSAAASASAGTSDTFNGSAGLDAVAYSGARAEYNIAMGSSGSFTVSHGAEVDTTVNVERLQFSDMKHALDMDAGAGTVAKLIATLWGQSYLGVKEFAGVGISLVDQGRTALQLADLAVNTNEFAQRAGSFSNADFVNTVAANLGYTGDTSGYLADLNAGSMTKAQLAVMASDYMASNMASYATLMGVMQTGIDYV
ncbi:MAG: carbohydrate-binding domain-containing protein [Ramlibacter sp.]